jgi:hypothetical protein
MLEDQVIKCNCPVLGNTLNIYPNIREGGRGAVMAVRYSGF